MSWTSTIGLSAKISRNLCVTIVKKKINKDGEIVSHAKMAHREEYEGKFVCHSCKHIFITTTDQSDHGYSNRRNCRYSRDHSDPQ
ncbi:hypothetical protein C1H46_010483 [Malus baccata]|uniref:Uncharacterized protein n=1 Tax=Malus baccata TaxID=106549 RepID=A0A540MYS9_MALBA|nr:hypothetical protein C1H46_010483 [Malus baccata]